MKDTHWDPIFRQLAQLLSNRLLEVCYSRTNLPGDLWGLSKLQKVHLEGDIKARNNCHVDANSGSSSSSSRPCSKIRLFLKYFNENNHNNSDSGGGTESQCIVNLEKVTLTTKQPMSPCFLQPYIQMHQERLEPYNCPMKSQNGYHIAERNHGYLPVNLSQCYTMDLPLNSSSNIPLIPRVDNPPILDLLQMTDYTKPSLWNVNNLTNTPNDLNSRLLRLLNLQAFNNRLGFLNNTQFLNNLVHKEYQSLLNLINILSCSKYQHLLTETCHTTPYSNPLHMNRLLLTTDELSMKAADTLFNRHNCIHNESSTILKNALSTPLKTLDFSHRRDDANFENSFLIYQPLLTQINNNFSRANYNLMRANHLPFYRPIHPVHLQPRVVFNVLSPNSTSVDQLNFLLKTVSPSNKRYCRLDMLFVQDEAKTRFMCQQCKREWTSMKGTISFLVILSAYTTGLIHLFDYWIINPGANVFFEIFPQVCSTCQNLCEPKWYPEEIDKVIRNLFVKIHHNFYKSVVHWDDRWDKRRRDGKPIGPHNSQNCIACQNGLCRGVNANSKAHVNDTGTEPGTNEALNTNDNPLSSTSSSSTEGDLSSAQIQQSQEGGLLMENPPKSPPCKRRAVE